MWEQQDRSHRVCMCRRYGGQCFLSAPGGGGVWPVEAPKPVYPGGINNLQAFHQDNSGGSTDHDLLRSGARPGEAERRVLQVTFSSNSFMMFRAFLPTDYSLSVLLCPATAPLWGAQGPPLMMTWPKSCGRSAAPCLASRGSEWKITRMRNDFAVCVNITG